MFASSIRLHGNLNFNECETSGRGQMFLRFALLCPTQFICCAFCFYRIKHKIEQKVIDCCWGPSIKLKWWLRLLCCIPQNDWRYTYHYLYTLFLGFSICPMLRDPKLISCSNNRDNVSISLLAIVLATPSATCGNFTFYFKSFIWIFDLNFLNRNSCPPSPLFCFSPKKFYIYWASSQSF